MKRKAHSARSVLAYCGLALLAGIAVAHAGGGNYSLPRDRIAGGASVSSGPTYRVTATVGQHEAGPELTGPTYRLSGGYVVPVAAPIADFLFADGFEP